MNFQIWERILKISRSPKVCRKTHARARRRNCVALRCVNLFYLKRIRVFCISSIMYKCKHCSYTSRRAFDLRRHQNRKTPCFSLTNSIATETHVDSKINQSHVDINPSHAEIIPNHSEINPSHAEINPSHAEINPSHLETRQEDKTNKPRCNACKKEFASIKCYKQHLKICKGHDSKTCPTCKKQFNSYQARWNHMKNGKCTPPPPPPASSSNTSIPIRISFSWNEFSNLGKNPQNIQIT